MTPEQKMQRAIDTARASLSAGELPVGAVLFHGDDVVSAACSSGENSGVYLQHAEMKVLLDADRMGYPVSARKEMQLFVTLEPCMMCLGTAMAFFVGEIWYAQESPVDGAVEAAQTRFRAGQPELPSYRLPEIRGGLLRAQSRDLLREYLRIRDSGPLATFCRTLLSL